MTENTGQGPSDEAPRKEPLKRRTREEQLYDFFLEDAREILEKLETAQAKADASISEASKVAGIVNEGREVIVQCLQGLRDTLAEAEKSARQGRKDFEDRFANWATSRISLTGRTVFFLSALGGMVGTAAGGVILALVLHLVHP